jgi:hypothetical protein
MLRVFFTGAFHMPRQFSWVIGITMFVTVLTANFTGYLLPWDVGDAWDVGDVPKYTSPKYNGKGGQVAGTDGINYYYNLPRVSLNSMGILFLISLQYVFYIYFGHFRLNRNF